MDIHAYFFKDTIFGPGLSMYKLQIKKLCMNVHEKKINIIKTHSWEEDFEENHYYLFIYFFLMCLPRTAFSILMNCYQWGSWLYFEKLTKEPMDFQIGCT